jgi:serine O-acetyltransferase
LLDSKGKGAPTIGNNCYIGAGAKIIGSVKIGNNCRIGANCVVYRDALDNLVAVLQSTRIIQKKELDNTTQLSIRNL